MDPVTGSETDSIPPHLGDVYYRIGSQVHDHEARIRLLERDTVMLLESTKRLADSVGFIQASLEKSQAQTTEKLDNLQNQTTEKLDKIDGRLTEHVLADGNSLRRIFLSSFVQFLGVAAGLLYIIFEGRFNG